MCSTVQTYGMWTLLGVGVLAGLLMGSVIGWRALAFHLWRKRVMHDVRRLGPAVKVVATMFGTIVVVGFIAYEYLVL